MSSTVLGESLGIPDAQVRKDLAALGSLGQSLSGWCIARSQAAKCCCCSAVSMSFLLCKKQHNRIPYK